MLVTREAPVCPVARETPVEVVVMVLLETGESPETLVPPERADSEETRESLDCLETWELPEREVCPERPEPRVTVVCPDDLETMVHEERMVPMELPEPPELRETLVIMDEMLQVWTEPRETLADLD